MICHRKILWGRNNSKVEVLAVVAIDVLQASMREKKKKNWDLVNPRISTLIPYQDLDFEKSDCIKCVE